MMVYVYMMVFCPKTSVVCRVYFAQSKKIN